MTRSTFLANFILFLCFPSHSIAHSIDNTVWQFPNRGTTVSFVSDTLFIGNSPTSTYSDSANILRIVDIPTPNPACSGIIGVYVYSIVSGGSSDTLKMVSQGDSCALRESFFQQPDGYGLRTLVGIKESKEVSLNDIHLYPNPSKGIFNLESPLELAGAQVSILDISGKVIREFRVISNSEQFEINAPKGIYFIQINLQGHILVKKLVIQ